MCYLGVIANFTLSRLILYISSVQQLQKDYMSSSSGEEEEEVSSDEEIENSQDCPQIDVDPLDVPSGESSEDEDQDSADPDWRWQKITMVETTKRKIILKQKVP